MASQPNLQGFLNLTGLTWGKIANKQFVSLIVMETRETKRQGVQNWESWAQKPNPKSELDKEVIHRKIEKLRLTLQQ